MSHAMNADACKTLERLGYKWRSIDGRHWDWYGPAVKESLTTQPQSPDVDLWPFLRNVLKRGAAIESQFSQQGYETFVSEIEAAARSEDKKLRAILATLPPSATVEQPVAVPDECMQTLRDMAAGDFVDSRRRLSMAKGILASLATRQPSAQVPDDGARDAVCHIAAIAHHGYLICLSDSDALTAVRRLSLPWFAVTASMPAAADLADAAMLSAAARKGEV